LRLVEQVTVNHGQSVQITVFPVRRGSTVGPGFLLKELSAALLFDNIESIHFRKLMSLIRVNVLHRAVQARVPEDGGKRTQWHAILGLDRRERVTNMPRRVVCPSSD